MFGSVLDSIVSLLKDCCGAYSSRLVVISKRCVGCVPFCEIEKEAQDSLDLYSSVNSPKLALKLKDSRDSYYISNFFSS